MTAVSKTLEITNQDYETVASLANITLTSGKKYNMQVQNKAFIKLADAEFLLEKNEKFSFTQDDDDLYIKIVDVFNPTILTILECA